MMLASTIVPVRSRWPRDARCALISSNRPSPRPCLPTDAGSSGWWSRRAAPPSTAAPRNASPTPPRREGPPSPGRSGCRTTARSEHAASPTAGTGADRAPPSHRTARSVAPAAPREPACPSSQGTTHAASGASSSRAPVPQSLPVPWLDHPIRDSCANYGTRDLIRPSLGKPRAGSGYRWTDPGSPRPHGVFLSAEASGSR